MARTGQVSSQEKWVHPQRWFDKLTMSGLAV
jgi:hypothetical protein